MVAASAAVPQDVLIGTAGVLQGVGQDWQAVEGAALQAAALAGASGSGTRASG